MNSAKISQLLSSVLDVLEDVTKVLDLDYELFKGATVLVNNDKSSDEQLASLLSNPSIKNVWPKTILSLPKPGREGAGSVGSVGAAGSAGSAYPSNPGAGNLQSNQSYSPHVMTQIDKLHAKGITGEGVKIAIVDSGVSAIAGHHTQQLVLIIA